MVVSKFSSKKLVESIKCLWRQKAFKASFNALGVGEFLMGFGKSDGKMNNHLWRYMLIDYRSVSSSPMGSLYLVSYTHVCHGPWSGHIWTNRKKLYGLGMINSSHFLNSGWQKTLWN